MEELINLYKKNIVLYNYLDIWDIFEDLLKIKEKLDALENSNQNLQTRVKAINNIDKKDIGLSFLFCYYSTKSHEEYHDILEQLFKFIEMEELTLKQKQEYVNDLCKLEKKIENKKSKKIEQKIQKVFDEKAEELLKALQFLAKRKDFNLIYYYLSIYINTPKYIYSEKEILEYLEMAKSPNIANRRNKKVRYLGICLSMKQVLMESIETQIKTYKKEIIRYKKQNEKQTEILEINKRQIEQIFQKDIITEQDIKTLENILKKEDLINKALQLVLEHNNRQIKKNQESTDTLKIQIRDLFQNYHYQDFSKTIKNFINEEANYPRIMQIMGILIKNKIELEGENLEIVLVNGIVENINFIGNLIHKNYFDNSFINRNIELLTDNKIFSDFLNKINLLIEENINIVDVLKSIDIMKISIEDLLNNLNLLKKYKIKMSGIKIHNYEFLIDTTVFDTIDLFIEESLEDIIRNHPEYLNKSLKNVPKRIHINHLISSPVRNEEKTKLLPTVLYEKYYFLWDKDLDNFLCNHTDEYLNEELKEALKSKKRNTIDETIIEREEVKYLDMNFLNKENYLFGATTISRIKFLRNYSFLKEYTNFDTKDLIYNALIYNSYLLHEELLNIKQIIENMYETKKLAKGEV